MSVKTKTRVMMLLRRHEYEIKTFGVKRLGLFGSFARNNQGKDSDVDILVEFEPGLKTYDNFIHLAFFLEDILNRSVDLLTPDSLSPYIAPKVMQEVEYVTLNI